ncbi:hypothetical protein DMUE_5516 [Dictyocoela muelleri]|nr:hypothetical protein DMUE_5516 [Dictyocoela muelleri]
MNKYGMIFHKIHERAVNGEDFKASYREIKEACVLSDISIPIFIMDITRIHNYKGLRDEKEISSFNIVYLPFYSPFLNPIENIFAAWKNIVKRGGACSEPQLRRLINKNIHEITAEHCGSFYRKMLGYMQMAEMRLKIFE